MFPSKFCFPIMLHNAMILFLVAFIIWMTTNPLALLGLFFCQQMPLVAGGDEGAEAIAGGSGIGFTADIE